MSIQRLRGGLPEKPPPAKQAKRLCLWLALVATCILCLAVVGVLFSWRSNTAVYALRGPDNPLSVDEQDLPGWRAQKPLSPTVKWEEVETPPTSLPPSPPDRVVVETPPTSLPPSPPDRVVDCTLPADVWTDALLVKCWRYLEFLEALVALEEPEFWNKLKKDSSTYLNKIRDNDGTQETCEKINQDLDDWLWQHRKARSEEGGKSSENTKGYERGADKAPTEETR